MPEELQVRENIPFQRRIWKVQPIIWCLMLLFVGLGFFGAFGGSGPLNQTTIRESLIEIEFERFPVKTIPSTVDVKIDSEAVSDGKIDLWLSNDYLTRMVLRHLYPEPEKSESQDGGTLFTFSVTPGERATISLVFDPHGSGRISTDYRIEGIGSVEISHLVYP